MKFLFICRGNVGRSQMAAAFFNKFSKTNQAESAGIKVDEREGQRLGDLQGSGKTVTEIMKEERIDISNNVRRQLTTEMINNADKIIVLAEEDVITDELRNNPKAIFWNIEDPLNTPIERHREIRDQIKGLVISLVLVNSE